MASPVSYFEIFVDDMDRAANFYETIFGWEIRRSPPGGPQYWMIQTANDAGMGIGGGMMKRSEPCPPNLTSGFTPVIQCEGIAKIEKSILKEGGKILRPAVEVPGVGMVAYALDSENNRICCVSQS